jgi:hypothetical protein
MVSTIWYKIGENHEGIPAISISRNAVYPLGVRRQNDINFDKSVIAMKTKSAKNGHAYEGCPIISRQLSYE